MKFQGYMRATVFSPKRAKYPGFVQPKHNGIRCLWDGRLAYTREGNIHKSHIQKLVRTLPVPKGWVSDGELVLPRDRFSFQQTQSAVAAENENSPLLHYPVFDTYNGAIVGPVFHERYHQRNVNCLTYYVDNLEEVDYWYDTFLEMGYEGLIFRTDTPYLFGSAGRNLMKKIPRRLGCAAISDRDWTERL